MSGVYLFNNILKTQTLYFSKCNIKNSFQFINISSNQLSERINATPAIIRSLIIPSEGN